MEELKIELQKDISQISEILKYAKYLAGDSKAMLVGNTSERFSLVNRDPFLKRIRESLMRLAVIEMCKIYGKGRNNDYSFEKLSIKYSTISTVCDSISPLLQNPEITSRITKLRILRNQHYAHSDSNAQNIYDIKFYYDDFDFLMMSAEKVISTITEEVLQQGSTFFEYAGDSANAFLDTHLKYRRAYPHHKSIWADGRENTV